MRPFYNAWMNSNLLALETSGTRCGVALLQGSGAGARVRVREHDGVQEHAERLLPMAGELLAEAGLGPADLGAVAFGQGPGGFTGLRVACGVAQGLAMALGLPVLPVPSHAAVASQAQAGPGDAVVVALDARMEEAYLAAYVRGDAPDGAGGGDWIVLQAPVLVPAGAVAQWLRDSLPAWQAAAGMPLQPLLAGDAWDAYAQAMAVPAQWRRSAAARPDAASVARLAWRAWRAGGGQAPDTAAPLYVRDKVAFTTAERQAGQGGNPRAEAPAMTAGPRIEPMSEADLDAVVEIEYAVQAHPWTRRNFADALAAGYGAWVMREAGRVLGFYIMMPAPDVAHLLVIAVARDRQGRGLGKALLAHCERQARGAQAPGLLLEVRPSNGAALAFYRGQGFAQIGVRRGYYPDGRDRREDALVMQKALDAAEPS